MLGSGVRAGFVVLVALVLAAPAHAASGDLRIEVLSNRADAISGGDALVQVVRPPDASGVPFTVKVGDRDVTRRFDSDGVGLIDGLDEGRNVVTATLDDGRGARITITNHPIGGPVFAGPQIQPWICQAGTTGPQCNKPAVVSYQYKDASSGSFSDYDPKNPPAESSIATTTTDQGRKVPYIVRKEDGVEDRGFYSIAVLNGAGAWNHKLLTTFGPNTSPHYTQPSAQSVMDDKALSRGFMVANNGLQIHGENTNDVVSTESFMMLKEHIIEAYGPIRYTMAQGCSGGSYQLMDEAMYPGLLDGLQPNCTFVDLWTTASDVFDCGLLVHYFSGAAPGGPPMAHWAPSIDGHKEPSDCAAWDATFYNYSDPTNAGHCNLPADKVYNPDTNPGGVRCTIADYMKSIFGLRPPSQWTAPEKKIGHGFANEPWGNEGVQYGLVALRSGQITPDEFVDLNAKIGGITIDGKPQAARSAVDENTASIAYRSGAVMDAKWVEDVPIIDLRAYNESGEIHTTGNSVKLRARLDATNGHHGNQITWTWNNGAPIVGVGPPKDIELKSFLLLDRWLSRIEADKRDVSKARKVVLDKPRDAVDACFVGSPGPAAPGAPSTSGDQEITDPGQCNRRGRAGHRRRHPVCAEPDRSRGLSAGDAQRRAADDDAHDLPPRRLRLQQAQPGAAALDPVDELRGRPGRQADGRRAAVCPVRAGGDGRLPELTHLHQPAQREAAHPRQARHPRALDRALRRRPPVEDPARRSQARVVELPRSQAQQGARAREDHRGAQRPRGDAALAAHLPAVRQQEEEAAGLELGTPYRPTGVSARARSPQACVARGRRSSLSPRTRHSKPLPLPSSAHRPSSARSSWRASRARSPGSIRPRSPTRTAGRATTCCSSLNGPTRPTATRASRGRARRSRTSPHIWTSAPTPTTSPPTITTASAAPTASTTSASSNSSVATTPPTSFT